MVPVELDKTRHLHFDLAAMRDLELALNGRPLGAILNDLSSMGINVLVLATYHGLKHEDKALNPKLVERILQTMLKDKRNLQELYTALPKALEETGMFRTEDTDPGKSETATA